MQIEVLYEDAALLVCLKPAGVSSEEAGLPALLRAQRGLDTVLCVHRLDLAAAGVMVYARTKEAAAGLSRQIGDGRFQKQYLAVVQGQSEERALLRDLLFRDAAKNKSYVVRRPRKGVREAELQYETLERTPELSLVRIRLKTGRTHQIRVQFASRGLPLAGDRKYGSSLRDCPLALWSEELRFLHPLSGEELRFSAPPPLAFPWTCFSPDRLNGKQE